MLSTVDRTQLFAVHMHALVEVGGMVGKYCDRAEHVEGPLAVFSEVGEALRTQAFTLAARLGEDLAHLYAVRLAEVEQRNPAYHPGAFDGARAVREAVTWRDWQLAQIEHDRVYHPDVVGMAKIDQMRHYAFHLQYLSWLALQASRDAALQVGYIRQRIADVLLFGLKFATIGNQRLPEQPVTVLA
ncbi:hypothetical protein ACPZ19_49495 [Amycolatopsis lurida]